MNEYVIVTDSCCDLTQKMADELGVQVLPLGILIDGKMHRNYLDGREISFKDFFRIARSGEAKFSTCALNESEFTEVFEPALAGGKDVLCIAFSSGLSATANAAHMAAATLSERYPQRKIYVVDTLAASMGEGLLVYHAVMRQRAGESIDQVRDWLEGNKLKLCHWFTVNDLHFLKRGGRVSSATAILGSMLQIKPVLHVDNDGHLINMAKARGRNASIRALAERMKATVTDPAGQVVFISHGDCAQEAEQLAEIIKKEIGVKEIHINFVGPVIGAHAGPGTIALFFLGTER